MSEVVIDVQDISKKYEISEGYEPDNFREKIIEILKYPIRAFKGTHKTKKKKFWALKNVSFQVHKGEVLGIIGRNGAGKSTLLKILSRITEPTEGRITMKGRVVSLLEVGTGFNPELTGRENIFLNGAILGMKRDEIKGKLDDIIEFSGVRKFIDTPVKRYSSGMYVRLAFAVAAHLDADVLLIDEVLAVGDLDFQKKSLAKISSMTTSENKTVIFVSHSMPSILKLCQRVVYLEDGHVSAITADIKGVIEQYSGGPAVREYPHDWRSGKGDGTEWFSAKRMYVSNSRDKPFHTFRYDEPVILHIQGTIHKLHPAFQIGYALYHGKTNDLLYWLSFNDLPQSKWPQLKKGTIELSTVIPGGMLNEGIYRLELMGALNKIEWFYQPENNSPAIIFEISGGLPPDSMWNTYKPGLIAPLYEWKAKYF